MNNTITYEKVLKEVDYILQNLPNEIQNKIPNDFKQSIVDNMDINYVPEVFDKNKTLDEQNISEETKKILALIYRNYIVSDEERKQLIIEENEIVQKLENEKRDKYNSKEIFKNKQESPNTINTATTVDELKITELNNKRWYKEIFEKILKFFKKNNISLV